MCKMKSVILDSYSPNHYQEHSLSFAPRFCKFASKKTFDSPNYTNGQKSCPVHKILNISFFVQSTKINQVSMERTIQDTFNDKILKEFGSVPSLQNPYKVGHYKFGSCIMMIRQNQ